MTTNYTLQEKMEIIENGFGTADIVTDNGNYIDFTFKIGTTENVIKLSKESNIIWHTKNSFDEWDQVASEQEILYKN